MALHSDMTGRGLMCAALMPPETGPAEDTSVDCAHVLLH